MSEFVEHLSNMSSEKRLYALKELPYHLMGSGQEGKAVALLCDLQYLDDRCQWCDVYELLQDYEAVHNPTRVEFKQYRDFIRKHAQRLSRYPGLLFSLIQLEGFPAAKDQAHMLVEQRKWHKPWLRTTPAWMPPLSEVGAATETIEVLTKCVYDVTFVSSLAIDRHLAFFLKGQGQIGMVDLTDGQELPTIKATRQSSVATRLPRPCALVCSPDGGYLVISYTHGEADFLQLKFGRQGDLVHYSLVGTFRYRVPRSSGGVPVMKFEGNDLWCQTDTGAITRVHPSSNDIAVSDINLSLDLSKGELSGITSTAEHVVITLRETRDTLVVVLNPCEPIASLHRAETDVGCLCACGSHRIAIVFTNRKLCVFDILPSFVQIAEVSLEELPAQLVYVDETLYWFSESGIPYAWKLGTSTQPRRLEGCGPEFRKVGNLAFGTDTDGIFFAVVTATAAIRFRITRGGIRQTHQILNVFETSSKRGYHAIQKRKDGIWLLDGVSKSEEKLIDETDMAYLFERDGTNHLLGIGRLGQGFLLDLSTHDVNFTTQLPLEITSVAGSSEGGFWLTDVSGAIYFVDLDLTCVPITPRHWISIRESTIRAWPGLVIWTGLEDRSDLVQILAFFRHEGTQRGALRPIGEPLRYLLPNGLFQALAYQPDKDEVMLVWLKGATLEPTIRVGRLQKFLDQQKKVPQERALVGVDPGIIAAKLTLDGSGLYLLSENGNLFFLDVDLDKETFRTQAVLSASVPITGMTQGWVPTSSLMLNFGGIQLSSCNFERGAPR